VSWHVSPDVLDRYARRPELLDDITASSVEQHLIACADCRAAVAGMADPAALGASWAAVVDEIDQPRSWAAEGVLTRLGVPADLSRLVAATPGLRIAWLAAVLVVAAAAVLAARQHGDDGPFLVIAPLVPLAAVAVAYLPVAEPAGEAGVAAPLHGAGLALRRTLAVLVPTIVVLALVGLALPVVGSWSFAWVLPGLGLAAASVALATFVRVPVAVGATAVLWLMVLMGSRARGVRGPIAEAAVFELPGQLVSVAVVLLAAAVIVGRRDRFETVEVTW
jgi:hypothetical protein